MSLETATYIDALVVSNPDGADARSTADDHLRLIKASLKRSFPMIGGAVSASAQAISYVNDLSASAQAQLNTLRNGPATANYAAVATTAISAGSAAALNGVAAGSYARLDLANTFDREQKIQAAVPYFILESTAATSGNKVWLNGYVSGNSLLFYAENDTYTAGYPWLSVLRSATYVESIAFSGGAIYFNGSSLTNPTLLNSVPAASYARLDNAQTFGKGTGSTIVALAAASSVSPNMADGNVHRVIMNQSMTIAAPTAPRSGQTLVLHLIQGGTGSYTASWSSAYNFAGGVAPTLSTAVGSRDVFAFVYDDVYGEWYAAGLSVS